MTLLSAATLLFFVMDPLGNVPLFLSALRQVDPERYRAVIVRELCIALGILVVFLFVGRYLLGLLHVSPAALTTRGSQGMVLSKLALWPAAVTRICLPSGSRAPLSSCCTFAPSPWRMNTPRTRPSAGTCDRLDSNASRADHCSAADTVRPVGSTYGARLISLCELGM